MSNQAHRDLGPVLSSGTITQGPQVDTFEARLQEYLNHPFLCTLNAATSGLTLALHLLGLKEGDEVLCPPLTCFATIAPSLTRRLKLVWVDIDPATCNIDLNDVERKCSSTTKAILLVHWGGNPVDLDRLHAIRDAVNPAIPIVEDCAHAFGAEYKGRKIGTHGNVCVFSTQAIKHLTTGDGGFMCLPNETMLVRAKLLRWYGIDREAPSLSDQRIHNDIVDAGYKFHMNDIAACIGIANLPGVIKNLQYTRALARRYDTELAGVPGIKVCTTSSHGVSAYWLYTIRVMDRDNFKMFMDENGIQVSQVHQRLDKYTCTDAFQTDLPLLDAVADTMVCIPIGWWVSSQQATHILSAIKSWSAQLDLREIQPTTADVEDYKRLIKSLTKAEMILSFEQWTQRYRDIASQGSVIFVVAYRGRLVGTAKLFTEIKFTDNVGHIEDVVVDEAWRHFGIGSMLVKRCVEEAVKARSYKVLLNTRDATSPFYGRLGFQLEKNEYVYRI